VLRIAVPAALRDAGAQAADVVGIATDFTASTPLPVTADGDPLCRSERWRERPHAWPKLWRHHAAQPQADRINALAAARGEPWLARYGRRISSEWEFAKALQDPDDWIAALRTAVPAALRAANVQAGDVVGILQRPRRAERDAARQRLVDHPVAVGVHGGAQLEPVAGADDQRAARERPQVDADDQRLTRRSHPRLRSWPCEPAGTPPRRSR
jgi:hypothetical protein